VGSGAGQIGFSGGTVSYEGSPIGFANGGAFGADLVVTFTSAATTTAVSALLNNITYLNANAATAPTGRVARFTLTDGDGKTSAANSVSIPMNVGGAATTYVWDGGGDGSSFSDPINWDLDTVAPDSNDIAIFRTADPGTVDLGGGTLLVGEIRFDGAGGYTLQNGTLIANKIDQQAAATGGNVISATISNTIPISVVVSGGSLLLSGNNTYSGNTNVNTGGTLSVGASTTASPLGTSQVNLNGGTLDLNTAAPTMTNTLGHAGFHINNDAVVFNMHQNGGMAGYGDPTQFGGNSGATALGNFEGLGTLTDGPGGRGLDFDNDADWAAVPATLREDPSNDGFVRLGSMESARSEYAVAAAKSKRCSMRMRAISAWARADAGFCANASRRHSSA
jgi:autotransporter-associated beta strand protein